MTSPQPNTLDLSRHHLTSVPAETWRNTSLQVVNLFRNGLTSIPAEITQLRALRVLIIANNKLQALPDELGALPTENAGCRPQPDR
jgi:Leucine-rich repeat (LRR) protein